MANNNKSSLRDELQKKLMDEIDKTFADYFHLDYPESCLDGYFSASHLRKIADAMDKLAAAHQDMIS